MRGKVVLLDFMASWCGICVGKLPEIKKLYRQLDRSKFEIISVSLDGGENTDTTIKDLKNGLEAMNFTDSGFRDSKLMRLKVLTSLQSTSQLSDDLKWKTKE